MTTAQGLPLQVVAGTTKVFGGHPPQPQGFSTVSVAAGMGQPQGWVTRVAIAGQAIGLQVWGVSQGATVVLVIVTHGVGDSAITDPLKSLRFLVRSGKFCMGYYARYSKAERRCKSEP